MGLERSFARPQDDLDALRKAIPGEPGKDYPIYGTSFLCKINPTNPGCGGGGGGGGGGGKKANGGNGGNGGNSNGGENGGEDANAHPAPAAAPETAPETAPRAAPEAAPETDYSAAGIAARKQALIDAIKKNVPDTKL